MALLGMRVMTTGINGKIVRAILQHQIAQPREDGTPQVLWEDVRELEVTDEGKVVLCRTTEEEQEAWQRQRYTSHQRIS